MQSLALVSTRTDSPGFEQRKTNVPPVFRFFKLFSLIIPLIQSVSFFLNLLSFTDSVFLSQVSIQVKYKKKLACKCEQVDWASFRRHQGDTRLFPRASFHSDKSHHDHQIPPPPDWDWRVGLRAGHPAPGQPGAS